MTAAQLARALAGWRFAAGDDALTVGRLLSGLPRCRRDRACELLDLLAAWLSCEVSRQACVELEAELGLITEASAGLLVPTAVDAAADWAWELDALVLEGLGVRLGKFMTAATVELLELVPAAQEASR